MASIKDFKKNINGYKVRTIENFTEAVRQSPGWYIGYVGDKGFINMIREVIQNSMDEMEKEKSPCTEIWIEYNEKDNTVICVDNGRGIPFDNIETIFTKEHTSSNFDKVAGEFSSGMHGVGAKVTNALSSQFFVDSYKCKEVTADGKPQHRRIEFYDGKAWKKGELPLSNKENFQGSRIEFRPCYDVMGPITTTCDDVLHLIGLLLPLMKIGAIINFKGTTKDGKSISRRLVNEDGIISFLICQTQKPLIPPIHLLYTNPEMTMKAEIIFTWAADELDNPEYVISFANMCPTLNESIHVKSFLDGLSNYFRQYMNRIFLGKNSKIQVQNSDIKSGLKAVISVFHIKPLFSGQAKEILSNADLAPFIKDMVNVGLDDWMKKNPDDVQRSCKFFKDVANLRLKANKEKITMLKTQVSVLTGLPSEYAKPTGKKGLELILVEGNSAASACKTARDTSRQGIFPLRGKVKNAMTCNKKDFFSNNECKAIYTILDCGEGRNCDVSKCKFDKIIFMADADMDGWHIRSLLLKMFLMYYAPLVEAGKVFAASPPLYAIRKKENMHMKTLKDYSKNITYFTDKEDYVKYIYHVFMKHNEVKSWGNKEYSPSELTNLLYTNYNYTADMKVLCENYAVDPELMEMAYKMIIHNTPFKIIKKTINDVYPFLTVKMDNHILVFDGLVGERVHTVIFTPTMLHDCQDIIGKYINPSYMDKGYRLNGRKVSLYGLMLAFHGFVPKGVQRFKGLGEMNPVEVRVSTIHPDFDRTLLQYTVEDMKREVEEIRKMDSDLKSLLDDVDVAEYDL